MSTVTLVPHGTLNGAQTYRTPDGRFSVTSSVTGAASARGVQRTRWWVATDSTQRDPASPRYPREVARATTLAALKTRLAQYVAENGDKNGSAL